MKKTTLFLLGMLFMFSAAQSQTIPNGDFENWGGLLVESPKDWYGTNELLFLFGGTNVFKDSDAHSGDYSARLECVDANLPSGASVVPGFLSLSEFEVDMNTFDYEFIGGLPLNVLPEKLVFWTKVSLAEGDMSLVNAFFTKWNGSAQDTVALATWTGAENIDEWTKIEATIISLVPGVIPDSANVLISASALAFDAVQGTKFWIDDIAFEGINSVENLTENSGINLFYNGASLQLSTSFAQQKSVVVNCYDLMGRLLSTHQLSDVSNGNYTVCNPTYSGVVLVEVVADHRSFTQKVMIVK